MTTELTWHDVLAEEKQQPYFVNTLHTVAGERQSGMTIYPPQKDVFNAFRFTELGDVKVVILGQDPYHGPGQAHGLAFSVRPGIATPPSLLNMYKELEATIPASHAQHTDIWKAGHARVCCYSTPCLPSVPGRHIRTPVWDGKHLPIKSSA